MIIWFWLWVNLRKYIKKVRIQDHVRMRAALLIIRHFFLLLSTWGGVSRPCVINQIGINSHSESIWFLSDLLAQKWRYTTMHCNESLVFWQAFVNRSVEWMSTKQPKMLENTKCRKGPRRLASSTHCLDIVSSSNQSWHLSTSGFWHKQMYFSTIKPRVKLQRGRRGCNKFAKKTQRCHSKRFILPCHHRFNHIQNLNGIHEAKKRISHAKQET